MFGLECSWCGRSRTSSASAVMLWASRHACLPGAQELPTFVLLCAPENVYRPGLTVRPIESPSRDRGTPIQTADIVQSPSA